MAPRRNAQAAELMEAERADREENADINEAIARTDSEVFTDALGDEPLEDDAGTELEDMGEGLEGDELDEEEDQEQEEKAPEGEQQAAPPESEESAQEAEGEQGEQPEGEAEGEPPAEQRPPPSIPPRVLRETRERARETESRLEAQIRDLQMRLDNFARQPPPQAAPQAQPPAQQSPKPDRWADPDGYDAWMLSEGERRAEARFNDRFGQIQQQQQRDMEMRLNEGLATMASGPRSYEFNVAYRDLTSLDKTPENAALVRRLVANPETAGQAILDWWEQTSNPDYIEYHRDQIRQAYGTPRPQRGNGLQRQNGSRPVQNRQVPRHEVRLPRSLSEATGGRSQHVNDPDMFDGAEDSIFAYGARR